MSPRRILPLLAVVALATAAPAFAQDPPAAEPAPAPVARPRAEAAERTRGGGRDVERDAPVRREPRPAATEASPRSRVVLAPAAPPASAPAPAFEDEQQGGRRNPRSGGGGSGASQPSGPPAGGTGGGPRTGPGRVGGNPGGPDPGSHGQAVPRGWAPRPPRPPYGGAPYGGITYGRRYYTGPHGLGYYYYDPWSWYAGYGYGYGWPGYYGSWGGYYGNYVGVYGYGVYAGPYGWDIGGLRLKVRPKDAEVYVDGYYAGIVDDFDGMWQQLRLDDGGYHIEIRKPGLQPLAFDIRIQPGRTITYHGDLLATP